MDLRYPQLIDVAAHRDLRGEHKKFFGNSPERIAVPFTVAEVFMTTSHANVVRGLHFQRPAQPKLVQAITGAIHGNVVCCNPELPEFGQAVAYYLEAGSEEKIYVPGDWAHGYRTVADETRVLYLAGSDFVGEGDVGIDPFDSALGLDWGGNITRETAIMADRDRALPTFEDVVEQLRMTDGERNKA